MKGELYNEGRPFKITSRDMDGAHRSTILADNYFGYCKKEVKTQIGYSANLRKGRKRSTPAVRWHLLPSALATRFVPDLVRLGSTKQHRFKEALALLGDRAKLHPAGYATDRIYPEIHYMPEDTEIDIHRQDIVWTALWRDATP